MSFLYFFPSFSSLEAFAIKRVAMKMGKVERELLRRLAVEVGDPDDIVSISQSEELSHWLRRSGGEAWHASWHFLSLFTPHSSPHRPLHPLHLYCSDSVSAAPFLSTLSREDDARHCPRVTSWLPGQWKLCLFFPPPLSFLASGPVRPPFLSSFRPLHFKLKLVSFL